MGNATAIRHQPVRKVSPSAQSTSGPGKGVRTPTKTAVSTYAPVSKGIDLGSSVRLTGLSRFTTPSTRTPSQRAVELALSAGATGALERGPAVNQLTEALKALLA